MLKAWQHYLGLCPIGPREQNCWVSQMQTSPSSAQDPEPFPTTSSLSSLWWVGWKSLRSPETLLTKNVCCFASWVKGRSEMQAGSSNLLEKVYAMSEIQPRTLEPQNPRAQGSRSFPDIPLPALKPCTKSWSDLQPQVPHVPSESFHPQNINDP